MVMLWGGEGYYKAYLISLKEVQKKILRIMSFKGKFEHTSPLFTAFNIHPIDQANSYMCLIYVYRSLKFLNCRVSKNLSDRSLKFLNCRVSKTLNCESVNKP